MSDKEVGPTNKTEGNAPVEDGRRRSYRAKTGLGSGALDDDGQGESSGSKTGLGFGPIEVNVPMPRVKAPRKDIEEDSKDEEQTKATEEQAAQQ